jgi:hypothetical protein
MIFRPEPNIYAFVGVILLIGLVKKNDHDDRLCPGGSGEKEGFVRDS